MGLESWLRAHGPAAGICRAGSVLFTTGIVLLSGWMAGCATHPVKPAPFAAPAARVHVNYFAGEPLSGASRVVAAQPAPEALAAHLTLISLERAPNSKDLQPLGAWARVVTVSRGGSAILPDGRLTRGAWIVPPPTAGRFTEELSKGAQGRTALAGNFALALPSGITAQVLVADPVASTDPLSDQPSYSQLSFELTGAPPGNGRPAELRPALVIRQWLLRGAHATSDSDSAPPPAGPVLQEETVLLDPIAVNGPTRIVLVVPFVFTRSNSWGFAAIIDTAPATDGAADRKLIELALDQARSSGVAASQPLSTTAPSAAPAALQEALALLSSRERQRQALSFLADQTGAAICQDVALTADASVLDAVCKRITSRPGQLPTDAHSLAWQLDRDALSVLAEAAEAGTLSAEMKAMLVVHAGELGRHASGVLDVLKAASNAEDLGARLTAENLVFLEDSSPAARVRAFDWLTARGRAPSGFDPLAPARDRRAALDRAFAPATQAAAPEVAP